MTTQEKPIKRHPDTYLEWLDKIPFLSPPMVVGRSHTRGPRVKLTPDGQTNMVATSFIQSTPLWLIVITKDSTSQRNVLHRVRVWLRTIPGGLFQIEDQSGFVTVRGAEWCAFKALNRLVTHLREQDQEFEREVSEG